MTILKKIGLVAFILFSGCSNEPQLITDVHTGTTSGFSGVHSAKMGLLEGLNVRAFKARQGDEDTYGLETTYRYTLGGWRYLSDAWSYGENLRYEKADRQVISCSDGICTYQETGVIVLTKAQFEKAAKNGLDFKLTGKRGSVVGEVPAAVFQQVPTGI